MYNTPPCLTIPGKVQYVVRTLYCIFNPAGCNQDNIYVLEDGYKCHSLPRAYVDARHNFECLRRTVPTVRRLGMMVFVWMQRCINKIRSVTSWHRHFVGRSGKRVILRSCKVIITIIECIQTLNLLPPLLSKS